MEKVRAWFVGCIVVAASLAVAAKIPEGADSPQALADRLQASAKTSDGYELAACTVPEDRDAIAGSLVFGTSMMVGVMGMDEANKAEAKKATEKLDAIFKKHGVDKKLKDPGSLPTKNGEPDFSALVKGTDTVGLSGDLMKFMRALPGVSGEGPFAAYTTISGLKVEGDKATATGPDGPLEFVKVAGRWYVHVAPPSPGPDDSGADTD